MTQATTRYLQTALAVDKYSPHPTPSVSTVAHPQGALDTGSLALTWKLRTVLLASCLPGVLLPMSDPYQSIFYTLTLCPWPSWTVSPQALPRTDLPLLQTLPYICCWCSVSKPCPTSQPHGPQHIRLPCPPPSPWVCSNSCPLSWWCHLTITSSSAALFFCLHTLPSSGSFPMSWLFASGGQSTGAYNVSVSVPPTQILTLSLGP